MLGLLGLLGAVVAGLAFDSGSDPREDEHEPQDTPEGEAWGVSAAYLGFGADEESGTDHGGTEPDGQPISNDTPTPIDPDRDMTGTAGADQMTGGSGDDHLTADAGDDHLDGRAGDDSLDGGAGQDVLHGGDGNDGLAGGDGDDSLWGDDGHDSLTGGASHDVLAGCEGDDTAQGGEGNDLVSGGTGQDQLAGGAGDDTVLGGEGNDLVFGGTGTDEVDGGAGNDTLWGAAPGVTDTDVDILNGGEGDDTLHLGAGDYGHGGAGADSFTLQDFGPGAPLMQITDFDPAEDDLVVIYDSALHPDPQLSLTEGNGATLLLLDGVPLASLTAGANIDLAAIRLQAA